MKHKRVVAAILMAFTALWAPHASAQQTESRLVGMVSDQNGGLLPGVSVSVKSERTGSIRTTVTDSQGRFAITNLNADSYEVSTELSGFAPAQRRVTLGVGETKSTDLGLAVAGVSEAVTVTVETPIVDTESAKLGVNVTPEEIQGLLGPLNRTVGLGTARQTQISIRYIF